MDIGVMSLIIFIGGVLVLMYGLFFTSKDNDSIIETTPFDTSQIDQLISELDQKTVDADKMLVELDKFSNHVQEENDKKYKELMMVYKLIDEKQQEIENKEKELKELKKDLEQQEVKNALAKQNRYEQERAAMAYKQNIVSPVSNDIPAPKQFYYESPNTISVSATNVSLGSETLTRVNNKNQKRCFDEVIYLYESGKNVDDIAKTLGKGKGEIRLMLDLMGKEE